MTSERAARPRLLRSVVVAWILAATVVLGACTGTATSVAPREYLDETTAATISIVSDTMVFACERPELAVHARDYVTLAAVDVNRAGQHALYLVGYRWSTLQAPQASGADESVSLLLRDRSVALAAMPDGLRTFGMAQHPLSAPSRHAQPLAAPIDAAWLTALEQPTGARIVRAEAALTWPYALWRIDARR